MYFITTMSLLMSYLLKKYVLMVIFALNSQAYLHKTNMMRFRLDLLSSESLNLEKSTVDPTFIKNGLQFYLEQQQRPAHFKLPRARMDLQFAVQLMRNSYTLCDYLDFTPMDRFQKNFFLFRQAEWEAYQKFHPTVFQGDLADPQYFDFISFCQYATIAYSINNVNGDAFVERIGAGSEEQVVNMLPAMLSTKDKIREVYEAAVGNALLDYVLSTYPSNIVPNRFIPIGNFSDPICDEQIVTFDTFIDYARQVLDIFAINAYTSLVEVQELPRTRTDSNSMFLSVKLQLPANMWSQLALARRKDVVINDFEMKVLKALARRCNLSLEVISRNVLKNIDLVYLVKVEKKRDEALHQLMTSVYEFCNTRNSVDNFINVDDNTERGKSPLPPSNTYIEKNSLS